MYVIEHNNKYSHNTTELSMSSILFWIAVGMFIAWNFPQPEYAKKIQTFLVTKWKEFRAK